MLLLGGLHETSEGGFVSNRVAVFDAERREWKEQEALPSGGFFAHRTVEMPKENGAIILCIGGYTDIHSKKHPYQMILFDVTGAQ